MMETIGQFLTTSPVGFIEHLSVPEAKFVIFCGTWLGLIALGWAIVFLLVRQIPERGMLAPFHRIWDRVSNVGRVILSCGLAYVFDVILKNTFRIGRPDILNFDFKPLLKLSDYGFPSGHATFYSALAVSMFFISRRAGTFLAIVALTVGAARIIAGVHTPLDILGGYLLGTLVACVVNFVAEHMRLRAT